MIAWNIFVDGSSVPLATIEAVSDEAAIGKFLYLSYRGDSRTLVATPTI